MKKILISAASLLLLLCSCNQNEWEESITSNDKNVVSATIEGQSARLAVDYNSATNMFNLNWSTGDSFKVFGQNSKSAVYNWSANDDFTLKQGDTEPDTPQYAIYPNSETNAPSISNNVVTMILNATPSVGNINLPMWAGAPTGTNYAFKHLAAGLRIAVNTIPAGYNQLVIEASNPISGTFTADLNNQAPALSTTAPATDDNKKVTVSFTAVTEQNSKNEVFYIPLPAGTYTFLKITVKGNGKDDKELKNWTNLEIVRGKMYYTTATVDVSSIESVNKALEDAGDVPVSFNVTEKITTSENEAIDIPDAAENVSFNFTAAPTTSKEAPLVFNQNEEAESDEATTKLNIDMPADATGLYAEINTPTATTTMSGGTYTKVTAKTATNTLIVKSGTTINTLKLIAGNLVIESGAKIDTIEVVSEEGLQIAVNAGGTVKLEENIVLTKALSVASGKEITLDLNGKKISQEKACTASYGMITNKGTLNIIDSSINKEGKISFTDTGNGDPNFGWGSYTLVNSGTLTVEEGTIENLSQQNTSSKVSHMYCAIQSTGTTTIKGGLISTPTYRSVRSNKGSLIIENGTFEGQVWLQPNQGNVTLTISGGTFAPKGVDGSSVYMTNTGENYTVSSASITGGMFTTKIGCTTPDIDGVKGCITGGTFTYSAMTNTNSSLLAEGYSFVADGENYVVSKTNQ